MSKEEFETVRSFGIFVLKKLLLYKLEKTDGEKLFENDTRDRSTRIYL